MTKWPVHEAKARFSQLLRDASSEGPQVVTKHGRPAAVVLSVEEFRRHEARRQSLADVIRSSPMAGVENRPRAEPVRSQRRRPVGSPAVGYLIDTCAIAELGRRRPAPQVASWFRAAAPESLFASVLTLGELRRGAEHLSGRRRRDLAHWMETTLAAWFGERLLPVDAAVVLEWGKLTGCLCEPMPAMDGLLAATALRHRLTIVTRNVADFEQTGLDLLNPWTGPC